MEKHRFSAEDKEDEGSVMVGDTEHFFQLTYDKNALPIINWYNQPKGHLGIEEKIKAQLKKKKK